MRSQMERVFKRRKPKIARLRTPEVGGGGREKEEEGKQRRKKNRQKGRKGERQRKHDG